MAVLFGLLAAVFYAGAYVLQYHEAHEAPQRLFMSPRLLVELARHPIWLAGIVAMLVGEGMQVVALGSGSLAVVEPLLAASLLFALPLSAAWRREQLSGRDWVGAGLVAVGLALLLAVGTPHGGRTNASGAAWLLTDVAAFGATALLVLVGRRGRGAAQAALLAAAAGVLFGLQDALTRTSIGLLHHGAGTLFTSWQFYVVLATGGYGLLLVQSAYEAGPLTAALPALVVGEPVVGVLVGVTTLGEHVGLSAWALAAQALGAAVAILGVCLLAQSRLVLGRMHPRHRDRSLTPGVRSRTPMPTGRVRSAATRTHHKG
jgi:drug/metabolite transporter (DMT)-like permease